MSVGNASKQMPFIMQTSEPWKVLCLIQMGTQVHVLYGCLVSPYLDILSSAPIITTLP